MSAKKKAAPVNKPASKKPAGKSPLKPVKAKSKAFAASAVKHKAKPTDAVASSAAKYVKPTPAKQIEIPEGSGVFYNPTTDEQEMHNLPIRAQGFIEHGLANGQFQIRINDLQGNPFSIPAFYSSEVKPKTFQLS